MREGGLLSKSHVHGELRAQTYENIALWTRLGCEGDAW